MPGFFATRENQYSLLDRSNDHRLAELSMIPPPAHLELLSSFLPRPPPVPVSTMLRRALRTMCSSAAAAGSRVLSFAPPVQYGALQDALDYAGAFTVVRDTLHRGLLGPVLRVLVDAGPRLAAARDHLEQVYIPELDFEMTKMMNDDAKSDMPLWAGLGEQLQTLKYEGKEVCAPGQTALPERNKLDEAVLERDRLQALLEEADGEEENRLTKQLQEVKQQMDELENKMAAKITDCDVWNVRDVLSWVHKEAQPSTERCSELGEYPLTLQVLRLIHCWSSKSSLLCEPVQTKLARACLWGVGSSHEGGFMFDHSGSKLPELTVWEEVGCTNYPFAVTASQIDQFMGLLQTHPLHRSYKYRRLTVQTDVALRESLPEALAHPLGQELVEYLRAMHLTENGIELVMLEVIRSWCALSAYDTDALEEGIMVSPAVEREDPRHGRIMVESQTRHTLLHSWEEIIAYTAHSVLMMQMWFQGVLSNLAGIRHLVSALEAEQGQLAPTEAHLVSKANETSARLLDHAWSICMLPHLSLRQPAMDRVKQLIDHSGGKQYEEAIISMLDPQDSQTAALVLCIARQDPASLASIITGFLHPPPLVPPSYEGITAQNVLQLASAARWDVGRMKAALIHTCAASRVCLGCRDVPLTPAARLMVGTPERIFELIMALAFDCASYELQVPSSQAGACHEL